LNFIYPPRVALDQVAYIFDYELDNTLPENAFDDLRHAVDEWKALQAKDVRPSLTLQRAPDFIQIVDGRKQDTLDVHTFRGELAQLYEAVMDRPRSPRMVHELTELECGVEEIEEVLDEFVARDLMMRDGNLFLALALPASPWR
jgi:hypothetical protein